MPTTLYIIDDEEDIRYTLFLWFKKQGYHVKTFSDSKEFFRDYTNPTPDLILLDVNLNGEDGRDICFHLKKTLNCRCPVILFSANATNGENYKSYLADNFVNKPFTMGELSTLIASYAPLTGM